jgi:hypothetical protein
VFGPVAVLFLAASLAHAPQIGVRHVLAAVPLLIVPASGLAASWLWRPASRGFRHWAPAALAVALLSWHVGGTVAVAPRYLQFFNEVAGGPANGHRVLTDSNLDWGQDLIRLKDWLDQHPTREELHLATFGRVDPAIYGIRALPLDRDSHGLAVVSASMRAGRPYFGNLEGHRGWIPAGTYTWLQGLTPIDRVGALFVYRLP